MGVFVGAGRRSLALSERSEFGDRRLANDKMPNGAFVGEVRGSDYAAAASS